MKNKQPLARRKVRMTSHMITLPRIVRVDDYHEFEFIKEIFRRMGITGIKLKELGCHHSYYGVMYVGKRPDRDELAELLRQYYGGGWPLAYCYHFVKYGELPE